MLHRPLQLPTRLALFRLVTALCATAFPLAAALASTPLALGARALSLDVAGWDRASVAGFEGGHRVLQEAQAELWRRQEAGSGGTSGLEMGRQGARGRSALPPPPRLRAQCRRPASSSWRLLGLQTEARDHEQAA